MKKKYPANKDEFNLPSLFKKDMITITNYIAELRDKLNTDIDKKSKSIRSALSHP